MPHPAEVDGGQRSAHRRQLPDGLVARHEAIVRPRQVTRVGNMALQRLGRSPCRRAVTGRQTVHGARVHRPAACILERPWSIRHCHLKCQLRPRPAHSAHSVRARIIITGIIIIRIIRAGCPRSVWCAHPDREIRNTVFIIGTIYDMRSLLWLFAPIDTGPRRGSSATPRRPLPIPPRPHAMGRVCGRIRFSSMQSPPPLPVPLRLTQARCRL